MEISIVKDLVKSQYGQAQGELYPDMIKKLKGKVSGTALSNLTKLVKLEYKEVFNSPDLLQKTMLTDILLSRLLLLKYSNKDILVSDMVLYCDIKNNDEIWSECMTKKVIPFLFHHKSIKVP